MPAYPPTALFATARAYLPPIPGGSDSTMPNATVRAEAREIGTKIVVEFPGVGDHGYPVRFSEMPRGLLRESLPIG